MKVHDFSDRGVFLIGACTSMPGIGSVVKLQMQGLNEPAPVVSARIVRFEASGVALVFNE